MKPRVYIETTIPSFYHEDRKEAFVVALRKWTREWWDKHRHLYDLVSSQAVLNELQTGDYAKKQKSIALLNDIDFIPIVPEITTIVQSSDLGLFAEKRRNNFSTRRRAGDA